MKLIDKIAGWIEVFSPLIVLVLLCISYLRYVENQTSDSKRIKKEIKQVDKKPEVDNERQSYWLFRD